MGSRLGRRLRWRRPSEESTADGIYGVVVAAAVLAASHESSAGAVAISVLVTLLIYWAAERYALLVAERIHRQHRSSWRDLGRRLTSGWEIVTASALPLVVLLVLGALGARLYVAELAALTTSTVLLLLAGWEIGHDGRLSLLERITTSGVAGLFGVAMIFLKTLLH